jgi:hypothetical protein
MRVPQQLSLCSFGKILHQRRRFSQTAGQFGLAEKIQIRSSCRFSLTPLHQQTKFLAAHFRAHL